MKFLGPKLILTGWLIIAGTLKGYSCDIPNTPWEFKTERTIVRVLGLADLERAIEVDASDDSFVSITENDSHVSITGDAYVTTFQDKLKKQDPILEERKDIDFVRSALKELYYGVFLQEHNDLIALYKVYIFGQNNNLLGTDAKFHKKHQGHGYGTEVKKSLFDHYQNLGLIPRRPEDKEAAIFEGFYGLINLRNKASLKCALNCGYKVGRLFGERVNVYYPFVVVSSDSDFLPPADEKLHDRIKEPLEKYLSRNSSPDETKQAEKTLRQISLKNLMSVRQDLFAMALESEEWFINMTMAQFPHLFNDFEDKLSAIDTLFSQQEAPPSENDILPDQQERYLASIVTIKQAKENIKQLISKSLGDIK